MLGCIIKREVPMPNTIFSQDKPGSLQTTRFILREDRVGHRNLPFDDATQHRVHLRKIVIPLLKRD